jgi:hypothetical protein
VQLKRQSPKKEGMLKLVGICSNIISPIYNIMHDVVYKIRLLQSTHNSLSRKIYYLAVILTLLSFWFTDSKLIQDLSIIEMLLLNFMYCAAITILATLTYPACHFGLIDIDGKNIVAYTYQIFFNNLSNQKMYKIFTLQRTDDTGQSKSVSIESTKYQST